MREHLARILTRVRRAESGCWEWTGSTVNPAYPYGRISIDGRLWLVHRAVYTILVGPVLAHLDLHHLCENPRCCNPDHLSPITRSEHVRITGQGQWRADFERSKTCCPLDHPYDKANTYVTPRGHRQCRICKAAANRGHNDRRRARRQRARLVTT